MQQYAPYIKNLNDGDVDFVIERCDASKTGTLRRDEILPAIAAWTELAKLNWKRGKDDASHQKFGTRKKEGRAAGGGGGLFCCCFASKRSAATAPSGEEEKGRVILVAEC
jgi:hypothetical protein